MRHYQSLLLCCLLAFSCSDNNTDIEPKPETMVSEIRLSLDNLSFDCIGGEETVKVELDYDNHSDYNPRWQLSGGESWCTPSETTGYSYDEVIFTVKANDTSEERKAIFTFTCGKVSQNLTISQAAYYYFSIHVAKKGTLASVMAQNNLDIKKVSALKITGVLNDEDFVTISQMSALRILDLSEVAITELPARALYQSSIRNLILPGTLTTIGSSSCSGCSITAIEIPASVETIGEAAFGSCSSLSTVTFEKGSKLTTIGSSSFSNCSITAIEIPASVETIGATAFGGCSSLSTVTFEKGSKLTTIGGKGSHYGAFSGCKALTAIEIPASVQTIEAATFKGCTKLATVTFEKGSQLKTIGGGYNSYDYYLGAFSDCEALTAIEIPASVQTIEAAAFIGCTKLATVTFEKGSQLKTIGGGYDSGRNYYGAFLNCTALTAIEIPASVETIEVTAFKGCTSLATVTFEKGSQLKTIDGGWPGLEIYYGVFSGCSALTSIEIPANVETIGEAAFRDCSSLATVTFEKGSKLKTIKGRCNSSSLYWSSGAFCALKNLITVDMSECTQVRSIEEYAFGFDYNLQLFKIGTAVPPKCGRDAFDYINSYSVLKVPSGRADAYKAADEWKRFASITGLDE